MRKIYWFALIGVALAWGGILFFGLVSGLRKTLRPTPKSNLMSATELLDQQRDVIADIDARNKRLADDREQKLEDTLSQPQTNPASAAQLLEEQKAKTEATREQQKRLMQDRKQRLRDMQQR